MCNFINFMEILKRKKDTIFVAEMDFKTSFMLQ